MIKKILFSVFSLFLLYRSLELFTLLFASNPNSYSFIELLVLACLINVFVTGIFAFTGFAFPTYRFLPNSYYRVSKGRSLDRFARIIGVFVFRKALLTVFWGKEKQRARFFNGKRTGITALIVETKQAEFSHLAAFLLILIPCLLLLLNGHVLLFIVCNIFNLILNFYPIILQRQHRNRINRFSHLLKDSD